MKSIFSPKMYPPATFLTLAAITTIIAGACYISVQQMYRSDANDPQIEAAEEIIGYINDGAPLDAIVDTTRTTDISKSLSVIVAVFDKDGKMIGSSALIGDQSPTPPNEIFEKIRATGEYRFTWSPESNIKMAAIARQANDDKGFVLVARSLREVENRIQELTKVIGLAWILLLLLSGLLTWLITKLATGTTIAVVEENIIIESPPSSDDTPQELNSL